MRSPRNAGIAQAGRPDLARRIAKAGRTDVAWRNLALGAVTLHRATRPVV
ncbi:hypothetical protein [Pseudonocardia cypriaca]|nr:hypothetical protein [Pseudonocardia cypriaca]